MAKKKQPTKKVRPGSAQDVPPGSMMSNRRKTDLPTLIAVRDALEKAWRPKPRKPTPVVAARKGKAPWGFYGYFRPHKPQVAPEPAAPATDPSAPPEAPKRGERQAVRKDPVEDLDAAIASEAEEVARLRRKIAKEKRRVATHWDALDVSDLAAATNRLADLRVARKDLIRGALQRKDVR